jgi:hypothetical protein
VKGTGGSEGGPEHKQKINGTIFWDVTWCILVFHFTAATHLPASAGLNSKSSILSLLFYPEDVGNMLRRNIGELVPNYKTEQIVR